MIKDLTQTLSSSERHRSGTYWCSTPHCEGVLCSKCAGAVQKQLINCAPHAYTRSYFLDYRVLSVSLRS